jgi:general secretion pathway protein M
MTRLRQRQLLALAAALVLILAASQWLIRPILGHRQRLAREIETGERRLRELVSLEQRYRQASAENAAFTQSMEKRSRDFTLFAFLEGLAGRDGLKKEIEFMRPSVKVLDDLHQEEQVEMRLNGVTLPTLIPYLYHIETAPEQVRITRLTIRPQQRNQSLLEVNLVLVTRGLREAALSTAVENSRSLP